MRASPDRPRWAQYEPIEVVGHVVVKLNVLRVIALAFVKTNLVALIAAAFIGVVGRAEEQGHGLPDEGQLVDFLKLFTGFLAAKPGAEIQD